MGSLLSRRRSCRLDTLGNIENLLCSQLQPHDGTKAKCRELLGSEPACFT